MPLAGGEAGAQPASLRRRALALIYEALLLVALLLAGSLPVVVLAHDMSPASSRPLLQAYLAALTGFYYAWQWRRGGQTLALKTWRLRIVTREGAPLTWKHAWTRYFVALPGALLLGVGFLWALVDRERLFLHDRVAGTRIIEEKAAC